MVWWAVGFANSYFNPNDIFEIISLSREIDSNGNIVKKDVDIKHKEG